MKLKKKEFSGMLLRNQTIKMDIADMRAHQNIIGDDTFKKEIKKEEKKDKINNIEDIFDKTKKKLNSKKSNVSNTPKKNKSKK